MRDDNVVTICIACFALLASYFLLVLSIRAFRLGRMIMKFVKNVDNGSNQPLSFVNLSEKIVPMKKLLRVLAIIFYAAVLAVFIVYLVSYSIVFGGLHG